MMNESEITVNNVAALSNVLLASSALTATMEREPGLPGMLCLYGHSGMGKSFASTYLSLKHRAYHVQARSVWARKDYLKNILKEMGIEPAGGLGEMMEQIALQLAVSGRPLIIDEADFLVKRGADYVDMLMDIYESSEAGTVMVVGMESLPQKLERYYEKIDNRMLHWVQAKPCTLNDCKLMLPMYSPDVELADDLLEHINKKMRGVTRRVATNLNHVRHVALKAKESRIDREWWGDRELHQGQVPKQGRR